VIDRLVRSDPIPRCCAHSRRAWAFITFATRFQTFVLQFNTLQKEALSC
jgi:hypothetical protein